VSLREKLGIAAKGLKLTVVVTIMSQTSSCHPNNSVKALEESITTKYNSSGKNDNE